MRPVHIPRGPSGENYRNQWRAHCEGGSIPSEADLKSPNSQDDYLNITTLFGLSPATWLHHCEGLAQRIQMRGSCAARSTTTQGQVGPPRDDALPCDMEEWDSRAKKLLPHIDPRNGPCRPDKTEGGDIKFWTRTHDNRQLLLDGYTFFGLTVHMSRENKSKIT